MNEFNITVRNKFIKVWQCVDNIGQIVNFYRIIIFSLDYITM